MRPPARLVLVDRRGLGPELVHNRADIEGATIIWARSLSPTADAALVARYGAGRAVHRAVVRHGGREVTLTRVEPR